MDLIVSPSPPSPHFIIPSSKSHTLRAILFAALASGTSRIRRYLPSPDTNAMIDATRLLGAQVRIEEDLLITGFSGKPSPPSDIIQCGNSGLVLRLIGALASLIPAYTILTGDASIRTSRPVLPLLSALNQLGAFADSNGHAPIIVKGPITRSFAALDGQDSQPVSGLLIAAAFAPHPIELSVTNPGEKPWIDLTLHWLRKLNIPFTAHNYTRYQLQGSAQIAPFDYTVPGDFSTAAFPIAAALITHSTTTLHNLDMDDIQGDKAIIPLLIELGARISIHQNTLTVEKSPKLRGGRIDLDRFIDALPILTVLACFADGPTELYNGAIARKKESDRIATIAHELCKMGANIEEKPDGLLIRPSPLRGAHLDTHNDHRIGLSLSVAALAAAGPSRICNTQCIQKTYPDFHGF